MTTQTNEITPRWHQVIENIVHREDPKNGFDSLVKILGDRGGWTRAGITWKSAFEYFEWKNENGWDDSQIKDQMNGLDKEEIIEYYWNVHILQPHFDILPAPLDELIVDFSVTSGSDDAVKAIQNALNEFKMPYMKDLKVDGVFGPVTRKELADFLFIDRQAMPYIAYVNQFIIEFTRWRIKHYINIVERDSERAADNLAYKPTQHRFMEGWFERAYSFLPKE